MGLFNFLKILREFDSLISGGSVSYTLPPPPTNLTPRPVVFAFGRCSLSEHLRL